MENGTLEMLGLMLLFEPRMGRILRMGLGWGLGLMPAALDRINRIFQIFSDFAWVDISVGMRGIFCH